MPRRDSEARNRAELVVRHLREELSMIARLLENATVRCNQVLACQRNGDDGDVERNMCHLTARIQGLSRQMNETVEMMDRIVVDARGGAPVRDAAPWPGGELPARMRYRMGYSRAE
jgi:hypothetical protein